MNSAANAASREAITAAGDRLALAKQLIESLEAGDVTRADAMLESLVGAREHVLFGELGKLTRIVHQAVQRLNVDARMAQLAGEVPDAQRRLDHVVAMTERAAHQTLGALEKSLPITRDLIARSGALRKSLSSPDAAVEWRPQVDRFLGDVQQELAGVQRILGEALMAQQYQDLTGQAIKQVTDLVRRVEAELVGLVRLAGAHSSPPASPRTDTPRVQSQDEVDALLSSLGF